MDNLSLKLLLQCLFPVLMLAQSQIWQEITLADIGGEKLIGASSALNSVDGDFVNGQFGISNLFDEKVNTSWAEGQKGDGIGEVIYTTIPSDCKKINVYNGSSKNSEVFKQKNRVKEIALTCLIGINPKGFVSENYIVYKSITCSEVAIFSLKDTLGVQSLDFPFDVGKVEAKLNDAEASFENKYKQKSGRKDIILKIEIRDIYKGNKGNETHLSEIFFNHHYIHNPLDEIYSRIDSIYLNDAENSILIDTDKSKSASLISDSLSTFQIMDFSNDNQWLIVSKLSRSPAEGRKESSSLIFNTFISKEISSGISSVTASQISGPYFFDYEKNKLFLEVTLPNENNSDLIELH